LHDTIPLDETASVAVGDTALTIENVLAVAQGGVPIRLSRESDFRARIQAGVDLLDALLAEDGVIYGVTTGYGDSCSVTIPSDLVDSLPLNLLRFHGCGMGRHLSVPQARAVIVARIASLSNGYSGVSWELLERLETLLNANVVPLIPEEGSVGASGDLTPLSYVAALLVGERDAVHDGTVAPAAVIHQQLELEPLTLRPKEGLAIMNGTAVMTALACEAFGRAEYLSRLSTRASALSCAALRGNPYHFDARLFTLKPHPGQADVAAWLRADLAVSEAAPRNPDRLQDRYSIRCAPHVIGVLRDSLPWMRSFIEIELNSTNDNPVVDGEEGRILHGGHFYGGHIAFAMDGLKNCVANIADLMDRQMALLVDPKFNNGLPANLSGSPASRAAINHGFKAVQIAVSAWTAEALKLTMPASVFSRSTENHNQDKVSMGTIAARDCLRVIELTEQVAAAHTLAAAQAVALRRADTSSAAQQETLGATLAGFADSVLADVPLVVEDRALEHELRLLLRHVQSRHWSLYE
jgi:histidine ammonia-lyase